jgi:hypothetical protein
MRITSNEIQLRDFVRRFPIRQAIIMASLQNEYDLLSGHFSSQGADIPLLAMTATDDNDDPSGSVK